MLKVSQLFIYPIKSLAGIAVNSAKVGLTGFEGDRSYMLVDDKNRFLTIREFPKMLRIQPEFHQNGLILRAIDQDLPPCVVVPQLNTTEEVTIWSSQVRVQHVSPEVDKWLSAALGAQVKMVYMPEDSLRPVTTSDGFLPEGKFVSFADTYPFMLLGEASIQDLNSRTTNKQQFSVERFRPNILFTGGSPYQEDEFVDMTINGIAFKGLEKCARCTVPNVDPENGSVSENSEPLATLSTYRLQDRKVNFGLNLVHSGSGIIHIDDEIKLVEYCI